MNADDYNSIITGGTSTQPSPGGAPSNTPAPTGINDPFASTNPGPGTGAPTTMPKQDSGTNFVNLGNSVRAARQVIIEARLRLDAADTELNQVSAELRALAQNPADRKLRADQLVFFPRLLELIKSARSDADPGSSTASELAEAEWIATMIQKL